MQPQSTGFDIDWVFTQAARDVMRSEGIQNHSIGTAPFPTLPIAGDLISWDWLADGRSFVVVSREFIWSNPRKLAVRLFLDIPAEGCQ